MLRDVLYKWICNQLSWILTEYKHTKNLIKPPWEEMLNPRDFMPKLCSLHNLKHQTTQNIDRLKDCNIALLPLSSSGKILTTMQCQMLTWSSDYFPIVAWALGQYIPSKASVAQGWHIKDATDHKMKYTEVKTEVGEKGVKPTGEHNIPPAVQYSKQNRRQETKEKR